MNFDKLTDQEVRKVYTFLKTKAENVPTNRLVETEMELKSRGISEDKWLL